MKYLVSILFVLFFTSTNAQIVRANSFYTIGSTTSDSRGYYRALTIDHTKVPNTNQSNFPVLFTGTYTWLKSVSQGGKVTDPQGDDIVFQQSFIAFPEVDLSYELVKWDSTTGFIEAWVNIPVLTTASDFTFYIFYGNSGITSYLGNNTGTWNANYMGVYHLKDGVTLNSNDATSNGANMTNNNAATATSGQIDGGLNLVKTSSQFLSINSAIVTAYPLSISGWFNITNTTGSYTIAGLAKTSGGGGRKLLYATAGTLKLYAQDDAAASAFPAASVGYTTNTWYYGVAVFESSSSFKIYQNGGNVGSSTASVSFGTPGLTLIGRDSDIPNSYFDGKIDEVHYLKTALTPDWIATEWNNQSSPSTFYSVGSENIL